MNSRAIAASILKRVIVNKQSLTSALAINLSQQTNVSQKSLIQELCYGVIRWYHPLCFFLQQLMDKPLKAKDNDLQILLLIGLYQLAYLNIPAYAAVSETVNAVSELKKPWACKLVNAVLRQFLREKSQLLEASQSNSTTLYSHPAWLIEILQQAWPQHWQAVLAANNQYPPFCLRINTQKVSWENYIKMLPEEMLAKKTLYSSSGIILEKPVNVTALPGFSEGLVSVQDSAAQLAAELLQVQPQQRILDACAAPGGKTAHILELYPEIRALVAIDNDGQRLRRVQDNLQRLKLTATLIENDAALPEQWWDKQLFDRILLDAPCSATGVIRRHPDIKLLKQPSDIEPLCTQQYHLLEKLWPLLKAGGMLLYCTCSILPAENAAILTKFLQQYQDAEENKIEAEWGMSMKIGRQILPGMDDMDGFYYARLVKR